MSEDNDDRVPKRPSGCTMRGQNYYAALKEITIPVSPKSICRAELDVIVTEAADGTEPEVYLNIVFHELLDGAKQLMPELKMAFCYYWSAFLQEIADEEAKIIEEAGNANNVSEDDGGEGNP